MNRVFAAAGLLSLAVGFGVKKSKENDILNYTQKVLLSKNVNYNTIANLSRSIKDLQFITNTHRKKLLHELYNKGLESSENLESKIELILEIAKLYNYDGNPEVDNFEYCNRAIKLIDEAKSQDTKNFLEHDIDNFWDVYFDICKEPRL